jgi:hypothetical protein
VLWAPLTYPWSERVKPLRVELWRLILVVVCFVLCVVVARSLLATNDTYSVDIQNWISQIGRVLHACRHKCITKPPKC